MSRPKTACARCGERKNHMNHVGDTWDHDWVNPKKPGLKPRSDKMERFYRTERRPDVAEAVGDGTNPCQAQVDPVICTGYVETIHEIETRARAGGIIRAHRIPGNRLPCCNACNEWLSEHPLEAEELGLLSPATRRPAPGPDEAA